MLLIRPSWQIDEVDTIILPILWMRQLRPVKVTRSEWLSCIWMVAARLSRVALSQFVNAHEAYWPQIFSVHELIVLARGFLKQPYLTFPSPANPLPVPYTPTPSFLPSPARERIRTGLGHNFVSHLVSLSSFWIKYMNCYRVPECQNRKDSRRSYLWPFSILVLTVHQLVLI